MPKKYFIDRIHRPYCPKIKKKIPNIDFVNIQLIYFLIIPICALKEVSWIFAIWKILALYSESFMDNSVPLETRMCSEKQVC